MSRVRVHKNKPGGFQVWWVSKTNHCMVQSAFQSRTCISQIRSFHFIYTLRPPILVMSPQKISSNFLPYSNPTLEFPSTPGPTARQPLEHKTPKEKAPDAHRSLRCVRLLASLVRTKEKRGEIAVQRANVVCGRCEVKECEVCGGCVAELDTRD